MNFILLSAALIAGLFVPVAPLADAQVLFHISVSGLEDRDIRKDGLRPNEFAELKVRSGKEGVEVKSFDITHARGKSPINQARVDGNSFNLARFREQARAGDRLVINIKTTLGKDQERIALGDVLVIIPIN